MLLKVKRSQLIRLNRFKKIIAFLTLISLFACNYFSDNMCASQYPNGINISSSYINGGSFSELYLGITKEAFFDLKNNNNLYVDTFYKEITPEELDLCYSTYLKKIQIVENEDTVYCSEKFDFYRDSLLVAYYFEISKNNNLLKNEVDEFLNLRFSQIFDENILSYKYSFKKGEANSLAWVSYKIKDEVDFNINEQSEW